MREILKVVFCTVLFIFIAVLWASSCSIQDRIILGLHNYEWFGLSSVLFLFGIVIIIWMENR
jgi:hypothetical protein